MAAPDGEDSCGEAAACQPWVPSLPWNEPRRELPRPVPGDSGTALCQTGITSKALLTSAFPAVGSGLSHGLGSFLHTERHLRVCILKPSAHPTS